MWNLTATLAGPHGNQIIEMLAKLPPFASELPQESFVDEVPGDPARWKEAFPQSKLTARAFWRDREKQVGRRPKSDLAIFSLPDGFGAVEEAFSILEPLPFEICALGATFFDEWISADYRRWSFSRSHVEHGWGCAFRGAGHDRLVSRRWLEFGPWRVIRRPDDTTFIQFHDLEITDPAEAYEQAKVGHERMGLSSSGGFIQQIEDWMLADVSGIYHPGERLLEVIVAPGISVPQSRMLNACVARLHHRLTRPMVQPVDRIAYVFLDLEEAHAHLHELWLRELECWVIDGAGKRRLDHDYHPVPDPPAWVKRLDGR